MSASGISDTCRVSARADTARGALAAVEAAAARYREACQTRADAERALNATLVAARAARCSVRETAAAAGMGKSVVHQIMRYGERGWG